MDFEKNLLYSITYQGGLFHGGLLFFCAEKGKRGNENEGVYVTGAVCVSEGCICRSNRKRRFRIILLKARKAGIFSEIAPVWEEIKKNGFYVSEAVEQMILTETGEVQKQKRYAGSR